MSRADDLQAAWERAQGSAFSDDASLLAAIPDLLAVVRAAQNVVSAAEYGEIPESQDSPLALLVSALAAFEAGGKP